MSSLWLTWYWTGVVGVAADNARVKACFPGFSKCAIRSDGHFKMDVVSQLPVQTPDTCEEQDHVVLLGALSGLETVLLVIYYRGIKKSANSSM